MLLNPGSDPNANVYASGWPLGHALNHEDGELKCLLLERGAKLQPHTVAFNHDVAMVKQMLEGNPDERTIEELLWSAADHGCPEIVAMALPHITLAKDDPRWHWVLMRPPRGASGDPAANEGHFWCLELLLTYGVDGNVGRKGSPMRSSSEYG